MSDLAHLLRLFEKQVQYCRSERRHFEFVFFTLQGLFLRYRQLELLPKILLDSLRWYLG